MYFKRLEIHGFKSFADPAVIEFKDGITAIVGPNGSGKSNISDALRWVLGEQSPSQLRGGRMEEVIFNGTETRRPRGMAEVTLVLDNSSGFLKIDYSEVAVTRRMYRNGDSEYLINGNTCRLKDIRELFLDTGIGVDGYSIIGQGKIQDIVSNKSESRREIFEESAGISTYLAKKGEAERKLEKTQTNLERIEDIVSELSDRDEHLRVESEKAKQYLSLNDRYKTLAVNIILRNIERTQEQSIKLKNDAANLNGQISFKQSNVEELETGVMESEGKIRTLDKLLTENREKLPDIAEAISSITKEKQFNEERRKTLEAEEKRVLTDLDSVGGQIESTAQELAQAKENLASVSAKSREADNELTEKKQQLKTLSDGAGSSNKIIDDGNDRLFELHSTAAAKKSEAKSCESYRQTLERRKKELLTDSETVRRESETFSAKLKQAESRKKRFEEDRDRADSELTEGRKRIGDLEEQVKTLRQQIQASRLEAGRMETRLSTIEEMEHNFEGYNSAVRYIMQANLSGVEGVAADMLEAPVGLETAVETALGAARQNIIVRDDACAKKAVNALKHNRAGRLTFLPVETIEGKQAAVETEVSSDPGYIGLAVDCVKFRERYRRIFRYLLGRTAIVEDLDTAIRLAKKTKSRIRFVTKEGEVVNASGAITGGQYRQQTAGILGRRNEKSRLSANLEQVRTEVTKTERDLRDAERSLETLRGSQTALVKEKNDSIISLNALKPEMEAWSERIEGTDARITQNNLEIQRLEREIAENENQIVTLRNDAKAAEAEIEKVNREINQAAEEFREKRRTVEQAEKAVTESRISANERRTKKESLSRLVDNIKQAFDETKKRQDDLEERRLAVVRERSRLNNSSQDTDQNVERLRQEKLSLTEKVSQLERDKDEVYKKRASLKEQIGSLSNEIESLKNQKQLIEVKRGKSETQLDNLKDKLWDEFEISYAQALDLRQEGFVLTPAVQECKTLRQQIRDLGDVNLSSIREFEEVDERFHFLTDQRDDVSRAADELHAIIADLDRKITKRFKDNFDLVSKSFEVTFEELFGGGHAELELDDEKDLLHSGIEIIAQPPGKKLQNINLLSGGEKTMTAIALMFAVLRVKPTPFCILDEVEAALDEANIIRFTDYLKNFRQTQFALITHQKATMEHADVLYGITMPEEGVSKVLSLKLGTPETEDFANRMDGNGNRTLGDGK